MNFSDGSPIAFHRFRLALGERPQREPPLSPFPLWFLLSAIRC